MKPFPHPRKDTSWRRPGAAALVPALLALSIFAMGSPPAAASIIPDARTQSGMSLSVALDGGADPITLLSNPWALATARTGSSALAIVGNPYGVGLPATSATHTASSDASASSITTTAVASGGTFAGPIGVATLDTSGASSARASAAIPYFARSAAISTAAVTGITFLGNSQNSGAVGLTWDFQSINLKSEPTTSLSFLQHTVDITQQSQGGSVTTSFGFLAMLQNGNPMISFTQPPGNSSLMNWVAANTMQQGNSLNLIPNAQALQVSVPFIDASGPVNLSVRSSDIQLSYEAPPAAVPQGGPLAGYQPPAGGGAMAHWEQNSQTLSFDRLPINLLSQNGHEDVSTKYQTDPLLDGFIEIDPLSRVGTVDGREYFAGGEVRLLDSSGYVLYIADLPIIVLDGGRQAYDFFGPILNVSEISLDHSLWLQDYFSNLGIGSRLLPELFLGLPIADAGMWSQDFSIPVSGALSFANAVDEPGTLTLIVLPLAALWLARSARRIRAVAKGSPLPLAICRIS